MVTVKQIERQWNQKAYRRVFQDLVSARPEGLYRPEPLAAPATLAAAMAVIRLDELTQTHVPLYGHLVRAILAAREPDGGWGDPAVTALCVRALQCGRGEGVAVTRGLSYLAELQKPEGIWPSVPLRRMPADAHSSAFILAQLGDNADFRQAVRLADAIAWFRSHLDELDEPTTQLWQQASVRCRRRGSDVKREDVKREVVKREDVKREDVKREDVKREASILWKAVTGTPVCPL